MRRSKSLKGLNQIPKVTVRVGESDDGKNVRWLVEKESDLILDQFGQWLAALIRAPPGASATKNVSLKDITNTSRTVNVYNVNLFNIGLAGTQAGVGSSSQAAARTDYNLISILGALVSTNDGVWTSASGQITFAGSILLSAGGTVREAGFFGYWADSGGTYRTFMLFRDVIDAVVIAAGKYAHVAYTIQC